MKSLYKLPLESYEMPFENVFLYALNNHADAIEKLILSPRNDNERDINYHVLKSPMWKKGAKQKDAVLVKGTERIPDEDAIIISSDPNLKVSKAWSELEFTLPRIEAKARKIADLSEALQVAAHAVIDNYIIIKKQVRKK